MKRSFKILVVSVYILFILNSSCVDTSQVATTQPIPIEYWPTEDWLRSSPEEQGLDSETLANMLRLVRDEDYGIDSLTVIRNGYIVLDVATSPFLPNSKHIIHSCTKSIVSALIGIAIQQGTIESVDQSLLSFFPNRDIANLDANKETITLEHLLTMTSGLACRDSYLYRWEGLKEMRASKDWIQYMLDLPMAEKPGTYFEYCNGGSFLLSAILQETTGLNALQFAEQYLFGPLGISDVDWPSNPQGINIGWGELHMRPHDMAKIGYLYLNEGMWDGEQIIPAAWISESTREHISATLEDGYGYQWWTHDSGFYLALGYAGQFIYVMPEVEMVVVFTSDLEEEDFYVPQRLLIDYILPAAKSSSPLPENLEGEAQLARSIRVLLEP